MKRLLTFFLLAEVISVAASGNVLAAEKAAGFEGTASVSLTRNGTDTTQFLFTRKGNQLRIENTDKSKPEPVNVVDLAANKLTIIYPHNSSFVQIDLTKAQTQAGAPNLPLGFPTPPNMNASQSEATTASAQIAPAMSSPPGFPTPPPRPSMPPMPNNPMASGIPSMPMPPPQGYSAPGMPPMPAKGGFRGTPELKKTDKTKKIQGFDCTLYTISDRMETFEIWATADSALFPFRLIQTNYLNRRFGPRMIEEQWIELVQKQSLFPLEATLRTDLRPQPASRAENSPVPNAGGVPDRGQERLSFKVDKIERKKIDNEKLFQPPEGYFEIQSPG